MDLSLARGSLFDSNGSWENSDRVGAGHRDALARLINAARNGDEPAFTRLIGLYEAAGRRVARQILRSDDAAEDAFQDALIKVHRAMPRFHDGNFRSWLLRIVKNTCYDHLRRQKRRPTTSLEQMLEDAYVELPDPGRHCDPVESVLRREQRRLLMSAINDLSEWHREVVVLVDVYGYDYGEAARALNIPLGTVKSRLSRARCTLRDRLVAAELMDGIPDPSPPA